MYSLTFNQELALMLIDKAGESQFDAVVLVDWYTSTVYRA